MNTSHEIGQKIENLINNTCFNHLDCAVALSRAHRYLQNSFFVFCVYYIFTLSEHYLNGRYDARNEYAVKTSKKLVEFMRDNDIICASDLRRRIEESNKDF